MGGTVLVLSSTVSVLGGLVFGYELGIISGALLQLQKEFHLGCFQQEVVPHAVPPSALLEAQVEPVTPKHGITGDHGVLNWITLLSMMAFVSAYSVGFGPMTWLVLSEIFPAGLRGRAFAFTNCFNWAANLIVTLTFLDVIDALSLSWTFLLYGVIAVAAVVFVYLLLPETKGKSLEEIDKELSGKR
ncbi:solute carrier family 2, facilitated glucose transporter member 10-like [Acipenser oxyrinchus oxyrinchus]|uniref:Solute carrier family 2, facilitated glucose transporter member 10 n=1 Tax=Acipenser oxyrinchus oxyrinchus TaxID=40147 RepID=A0AAD8FPW1_ACIOX|nr:solute carrier family 2, facilitated glucose transporter member 10-like [Acipenser oxyrinchus oxyrinchus]